MAQALPLARSSISRTVTKLVDRGLIQRRRLLSDRRVVILTLTEEGMTLTQDLHRRVQAYETGLCRSVSDKRWGLYCCYLNNHGELCCPGVIEDSATQDLRRANTGSAQERLKLGRRAVASRPMVCRQLFSWASLASQWRGRSCDSSTH